MKIQSIFSISGHFSIKVFVLIHIKIMKTEADLEFCQDIRENLTYNDCYIILTYQWFHIQILKIVLKSYWELKKWQRILLNTISWKFTKLVTWCHWNNQKPVCVYRYKNSEKSQLNTWKSGCPKIKWQTNIISSKTGF